MSPPFPPARQFLIPPLRRPLPLSMAALAVLLVACDSPQTIEPRFAADFDEHYHCHWEEDPPGDPEEPPILTRSSSSGRYYCHWVPGPTGWDPAGPDDPSLEGGSFHYSPPSIEEDPNYWTRGSLWYDDVFGPATQFVPDCQNLHKRDHHGAEWTWCFLAEADSSYVAIVESVVPDILARCPELTTAWNRIKVGIRVWDYAGEPYAGATRAGERWVLFSRGWVDTDAELIVAHELVHHLRKYHRERDHTLDFIAKEKECSGGRSIFP